MEDLTGKIFKGIKVLGLAHKVGNRPYWKLQCSCGKLRSPLRGDSLKKHSGRCTCPIAEGTVYGLLTYKKKTKVIGKRSYCEVTCECGFTYETRTDVFKSNISGCGKCINTFTEEDETLLLEVSTEKYPKTYTRIDKVSYNKIKHLKWYAVQGSRTLYVQASDGKDRILLHRLILDCAEHLLTDHEDGDGLNNTTANLREVDKQGNGRNTPKPVTNTTGCMGVSKTKDGKFRAYITVGGVQISLGTYTKYKDAVVSRKDAETLYGFHANHGRIINPSEIKG